MIPSIYGLYHLSMIPSIIMMVYYCFTHITLTAPGSGIQDIQGTWKSGRATVSAHRSKVATCWDVVGMWSGWWFQPSPLKKYEGQLGWFFPIYIYIYIWKNKKKMFQSTNRLWTVMGCNVTKMCREYIYIYTYITATSMGCYVLLCHIGMGCYVTNIIRYFMRIW